MYLNTEKKLLEYRPAHFEKKFNGLWTKSKQFFEVGLSSRNFINWGNPSFLDF